MGEFVYGDRDGSSPNDGEGARGDEEAGPKAQGEVGKAGREGGLRGPMEMDETNAARGDGCGKCGLHPNNV